MPPSSKSSNCIVLGISLKASPRVSALSTSLEASGMSHRILLYSAYADSMKIRVFSRSSSWRSCGNMVRIWFLYRSMIVLVIYCDRSSYLVTIVFMWITAAVLAEICSALPLSGSIYIWAAESAGPKYARFIGFVVAWWACTAWMTFAAGNCQVRRFANFKHSAFITTSL